MMKDGVRYKTSSYRKRSDADQAIKNLRLRLYGEWRVDNNENAQATS